VDPANGSKSSANLADDQVLANSRWDVIARVPHKHFDHAALDGLGADLALAAALVDILPLSISVQRPCSLGSRTKHRLAAPLTGVQRRMTASSRVRLCSVIGVSLGCQETHF
jgi:hypothetical protein